MTKSSPFIKIDAVNGTSSSVSITFTIKSIEVRTITQNQQQRRVIQCLVQDDTAELFVGLEESFLPRIKAGNSYLIKGGEIRIRDNRLYLCVGQKGILSDIEKLEIVTKPVENISEEYRNRIMRKKNRSNGFVTKPKPVIIVDREEDEFHKHLSSRSKSRDIRKSTEKPALLKTVQQNLTADSKDSESDEYNERDIFQDLIDDVYERAAGQFDFTGVPDETQIDLDLFKMPNLSKKDLNKIREEERKHCYQSKFLEEEFNYRIRVRLFQEKFGKHKQSINDILKKEQYKSQAQIKAEMLMNMRTYTPKKQKKGPRHKIYEERRVAFKVASKQKPKNDNRGQPSSSRRDYGKNPRIYEAREDRNAKEGEYR